jgi:hypothetical protein
MCQLTYIQIPKKNCAKYSQVKRALMSTVLRLNSQAGHKDGFGIFSDNEVYTNAQAANEFKNIGKVITFNDDSPIFGHVRRASNGFKKIDKDSTHPFLYNDDEKKISLVLAHNGTLDLKDGKIPEGYIDSSYFGKLLFDNLVKGNDYQSAIEETYALFDGKYAFLTWYNGIYHIVKGRSANLFFCDIKVDDEPAGFIVNTEKNSMLISLLTAFDFFTDITVTFEEPEQILANKMMLIEDTNGVKFKDSMTLLDSKMIETTKVWQSHTTKRAHNRNKIPSYPNMYNNIPDDDVVHALAATAGSQIPLIEKAGNDKTKTGPTALDTLLAFFERYDISILELDHIFMVALHKGILEILPSDLDAFCKDVLPLIDDHAANKRIKVFRKLLVDYNITEKTAYSRGIVPFPNFLVGPKELQRGFEEHMKRGNKQ